MSYIYPLSNSVHTSIPVFHEKLPFVMNVYGLKGDSLQRNNTAGSSVGGVECYLENTSADWSKTGQEPYGEWCARIQGDDVGCARHQSTECTLLPNLKSTNTHR